MKVIVITVCLALLIESEKLAIEQVGVREHNNRGKEVEIYLASVGLPPGNPYCMAGLYWTFDVASKVTKCKNPLLRTGSTYRQFEHLKKVGKDGEKAVDRHTLIFWRKGRTWNGHVGRVLMKKQGGWFYVLEFNTDCKGYEGVCVKLRNIYHPLGMMQVLGFVNWFAQ